VLDRHEWRPQAHDHLLRPREDVVRGRLGVAGDPHLDLDLVDGVRVDTGLVQLAEQTIPIWDARRLDMDVVLRDGGIVTLRARGIVRPVAVATEREYGLFINGELVEPQSGEIRELTEPATGEPLARAAMAGPDDVDRAVAAARAALSGDWGKTPANERSRLLHALADAIAANRKELAELESRNVGKAISSVKAELAQAVENFRFYASAIATIGRARSGARCSSTP
jgi:hypothetical protein